MKSGTAALILAKFIHINSNTFRTEHRLHTALVAISQYRLPLMSMSTDIAENPHSYEVHFELICKPNAQFFTSEEHID